MHDNTAASLTAAYCSKSRGTRDYRKEWHAALKEKQEKYLLTQKDVGN